MRLLTISYIFVIVLSLLISATLAFKKINEVMPPSPPIQANNLWIKECGQWRNAGKIKLKYLVGNTSVIYLYDGSTWRESGQYKIVPVSILEIK